ncbi:uncharacterized protein J4E92_001598 [Alternaria infectoria]|uniref:uncharacterized protein n=1 Tax=Alternaria infectoria TaxID=45303 RepID=UPI00221F8C07|nr:uncharacterized protein J4E92_001598 [Alternaria infectoria]KAI4936873.1 hypothetical protein J4E92_001598 [Alternaria infectoria]
MAHPSQQSNVKAGLGQTAHQDKENVNPPDLKARLEVRSDAKKLSGAEDHIHEPNVAKAPAVPGMLLQPTRDGYNLHKGMFQSTFNGSPKPTQRPWLQNLSLAYGATDDEKEPGTCSSGQYDHAMDWFNAPLEAMQWPEHPETATTVQRNSSEMEAPPGNQAQPWKPAFVLANQQPNPFQLPQKRKGSNIKEEKQSSPTSWQLRRPREMMARHEDPLSPSTGRKRVKREQDDQVVPKPNSRAPYLALLVAAIPLADQADPLQVRISHSLRQALEDQEEGETQDGDILSE